MRRDAKTFLGRNVISAFYYVAVRLFGGNYYKRRQSPNASIKPCDNSGDFYLRGESREQTNPLGNTSRGISEVGAGVAESESCPPQEKP